MSTNNIIMQAPRAQNHPTCSGELFRGSETGGTFELRIGGGGTQVGLFYKSLSPHL